MSPKITLSEPGDLKGFPMVRPPARVHRVCRREHGTWWFSSDGSGRFDLELPEGTCYFATDAYAAIREASRLGPVTPAWVKGREDRSLNLPKKRYRLAGTTRTAAGAYGITNELMTIVPYDLPQRWAAAFRTHGFDGVRHQLRHDQRARAAGISLFGEAGSNARPAAIAAPLDVDAVKSAGVRVLDPPFSAVLTIVGGD